MTYLILIIKNESEIGVEIGMNV